MTKYRASSVTHCGRITGTEPCLATNALPNTPVSAQDRARGRNNHNADIAGGRRSESMRRSRAVSAAPKGRTKVSPKADEREG